MVKNGVIVGDDSIYSNLDYRNVAGAQVNKYTFVTTVDENSTGKYIVKAENKYDNHIWKTMVINKLANNFDYKFGSRLEEGNADTPLLATKSYIVIVHRTSNDANNTRTWNIYDRKTLELLYSFTQNTNVDKRWAQIVLNEIDDGRLIYASQNYNEAWTGSSDNQTIHSGYIDVINKSHTDIEYTWTGKQYMPESIWYDGTDYYIGLAVWNTKSIPVLKNGKLWATGTSSTSSNYHGGYICGNETYIYVTAGTNTPIIIAINKSTGAASAVTTASGSTCLGYNYTTKACYAIVGNTIYLLNGTSVTSLYTAEKTIADGTQLMSCIENNGNVYCISAFGERCYNITTGELHINSTSKFNAEMDMSTDTAISIQQDSNYVYITDMVYGYTVSNTSISDKQLLFGTANSPVNGNYSTYFIINDTVEEVSEE